MENPVRVARKSLGLTQAQLAMICGCSTVQVYDAERGGPSKVMPIIANGLSSMGCDTEKLAVEYAAWRQLAGIRLREQVRQRQGIANG